MRRWPILALLATLGLAASGLGAPPDDDKKPAQSPTKTPADELKAMQKEFGDLQTKFFEKYKAAKSKEVKKKLLENEQPDPTPFQDRALKFAEANAGTPAEINAVLWTIQVGMNSSKTQNSPQTQRAETILVEKVVAKAPLAEVASKLRVRVGPDSKVREAALLLAQTALDDKDAPRVLSWVAGSFEPSKTADKAREILMDKFINHDVMMGVAQMMSFGFKKEDTEKVKAAIDKLRTILAKSTNPKVQAAACFSLASVLKDQGAEDKKEAEHLFQRVRSEFASVNKMFAARAKGELNALHGLLDEGKPALPIEGVDLDGKPFKLADYRGKVVLLDFWGFW